MEIKFDNIDGRSFEYRVMMIVFAAFAFIGAIEIGRAHV